MDTPSGELTLSELFCLPAEKGSILKGKNLLPFGSKFLPFRVDLLRMGLVCRKTNMKLQRLSPLKIKW